MPFCTFCKAFLHFCKLDSFNFIEIYTQSIKQNKGECGNHLCILSPQGPLFIASSKKHPPY